MKHHDLNFLQAELTRVSEWVQFADKKAGFLGVFYSAVLGYLITEHGTIFAGTHHHYYEFLHPLHVFLFSVLVELLMVGVVFLYLTVAPRLGNNNTNKSLFYFGNVAEKKIEDYLQDINRLTDDEAQRQIAEQIHTNSVIASVKMKHAKTSTQILLTIGIVLLLLTFI